MSSAKKGKGHCWRAFPVEVIEQALN